MSKTKQKNQIVKIFLKSMKKPLCFEVENAMSYDKLKKDLRTNDVVEFGPAVFRREDFQYSVLE